MLIGAVFASPCADIFFAGSGADQFVENGVRLAGGGAEQAAEPLDVFANAGGTGENDADSDGGDVHPLIEHLAGDEHLIGSRPEEIEKLLAFGGLVRCVNTGQQNLRPRS